LPLHRPRDIGAGLPTQVWTPPPLTMFFTAAACHPGGDHDFNLSDTRMALISRFSLTTTYSLSCLHKMLTQEDASEEWKERTRRKSSTRVDASSPSSCHRSMISFYSPSSSLLSSSAIVQVTSINLREVQLTLASSNLEVDFAARTRVAGLADRLYRETF
jgi:hypothetical protein